MARGIGTRMRAAADDFLLTPEQNYFAGSGLKALIPLASGKCLLELLVDNISRAGFSDIYLVVAPEHDAIGRFCAERKIDATFAIQQEALGTADAVLAVERYVDEGELFLVVNSDNLYGAEQLKALRDLNRPALLAFERRTLVAESNIPDERTAKFATVEIDDRGHLARISEKSESVGPDTFVSMNAWLFSPVIFPACRAIGPSVRGELEITAAVQHAVDHLGTEFVAVRTNAGVLDLSGRADIEAVSRRLSPTTA